MILHRSLMRLRSLATAQRLLPLATVAGAWLLGGAAAHGQILTASYWNPGDGRFGQFIADLGDVNGDGTSELFIGEPEADPSGVTDAGRVFVIEPNKTFYWIHYLEGTQTGAEFGSSGCKLGDVDGDGYGDFAISAPFWNTATHADAGRIVAYSGKTGSVMWTFDGSDTDEELGTLLAWLGDIDGDGIDEFAATRPNDGEVLVLDGNGDKKYAIVRGPNVEFAAAIARCDDLDGDGRPDLIVGEPGYDQFFPPLLDCGRAVVYSGVDGTQLTHVAGSFAGERLGSSVSGCGDVDDDGRGDFLTGAMETDKSYTDNGSVSLWSGASFTTLLKIYGEDDDDRLGLRVAGLGDFDGDGIEDFAASAKDGGADEVGLVAVWSGADGHELYRWEGTNSNGAWFSSELGIGLCAGDWNGDAFADLAWADPEFAFYPYGSLEITGGCNTFIGAPSAAENYGAGWPGRFGVPSLTALNEPVIGAPISVTVGNSLGAPTLALLMLGSQPASILTSKGGTILCTDDLASFIFTVDTAGTTFTEDVPWDNSLATVEFFVQVLEADPFASKKLSFTPGLKLRIGIDMP